MNMNLPKRHLLLIATIVGFLFLFHLLITRGSSNTSLSSSDDRRRRLSAKSDDAAEDRWFSDVPRIHSLATTANAVDPSQEVQQLRILIVVTSLVEYDKGTRGTKRGYDRLQHVVLPQLTDSVSSMTSRGWDVDVYLILGYDHLQQDRRQLIEDSLPKGVGLEVWEDAIPLFYDKTFGKRPKPDQSLKMADHALSRQHRFVLRDKLQFYDFFVCFEDDMRVTADHVINFLKLSSDIKNLHKQALSSSDQHVHVLDPYPPKPQRHQSNDGASFGNDVVDDPISADNVKRLFPGFLRVEVVDRKASHPLQDRLGNHHFAKEVPPSTNAFVDVVTGSTNSNNKESILKTICCDEDDPPRGKMTAHPKTSEIILWETNIQATGVRKYPPPLNWAAAMPVEDKADIGSYWSGHPALYGTKPNDLKRPRRIDATIGNQAGFMGTRSQIEYFHEVACPGGFLPPYNSEHWKGDSLQRHSVEFWSGGFQLFGQCYLNRILSLDPRIFERQLIYHVSNNKQRTIPAKKVIRVGDFYGQIMKVKERAEEFAKQPLS